MWKHVDLFAITLLLAAALVFTQVHDLLVPETGSARLIEYAHAQLQSLMADGNWCNLSFTRN